MFEIDAVVTSYNIVWSLEAQKIYTQLDPKRAKKVLKALKLLSSNPYHNSLNCHKIPPRLCIYQSKKYESWEAYIENHTSSAWRMIYCYLPNNTIYLSDIIKHL